jgi:hypothetical protein
MRDQDHILQTHQRLRHVRLVREDIETRGTQAAVD